MVSRYSAVSSPLLAAVSGEGMPTGDRPVSFRFGLVLAAALLQTVFVSASCRG